MRTGHRFAKAPTLDSYCAMQHLVVSLTGDAQGFVDRVLAEQGRARRVALTVPNFMFALAVIAETDLISALPRRFVAMQASRFGVLAREPPMQFGRFRLNRVVLKVGMMDAGLGWMFEQLVRSVPAAPKRNSARGRTASASSIS